MNKLTILAVLALAFITTAYAQETCEKDSCILNNLNITENITQNTPPAKQEGNEEEICIIYFYGEGCSKCAEIKPFIEEIEEKYRGKLHIEKLELYHNLDNYNLYNKYCTIQNIPLEERGIPLVAIGNEFFQGTTQIRENLESKIKEAIDKGENICPLPEDMRCNKLEYNNTETNQVIPGLKEKITLPVIITAGLIDGINPCAFAVLIFLLTFLIEVSSTKKRMLKAGITYIIAVYITYFLAGFGLLSALQITGMTGIIMKIAGILAIIFGIINIKDFIWYGKGISLQIPESRKETIQKWVHKANIPAAIVLGFLVSMFELPCTGGIYLGILAMLANTVTQTTAIYYLLLYNLMFILPLLAILLAMAFGMKAEHIENWRQAKKNWMKLGMGLLLLGLGIALLLGWFA